MQGFVVNRTSLASHWHQNLKVTNMTIKESMKARR